jgi:hypothetical protein
MPKKNPIIGKWSGNKEKLEFKQDKTFIIDQWEGKWSIRGQYLSIDIIVNNVHEKLKRKFVIDKTLKIEGQDGEMISYRSIK